MAKRNLAQAASWLGNIRARTWLILGGLAFAIVGLLVWAGIALLSWLWALAPVATETGKRLADEAAATVEQAAPGLKEQAERWLPGIQEQAARWLPGLGEAPPARDVSGTDLGPVPRFPGLVRSHYARDGETTEVRYAGRADFDAALAHYVRGFADAGFAQEVISATPEEERHRFRHGQDSIAFALMRGPGGLIEVRLQHSSRQ